MLTLIKFVNNLTHLSTKIRNAFFFYLIMPVITNKNYNYNKYYTIRKKKKKSLILDKILLKKKNVRFTISMEIIPLVNQRKAPFS